MNDSRDTMNSQVGDTTLSTRERILHAALSEFAQHGFKGASIRGIARVAGVSPGLVQHHFGTKDGLQEECDHYVMEFLKDAPSQLLQPGLPPPPDVTAKYLDRIQPIVDYLIMSLSSGSERSATWFNNITDYTHEAMTSGRLGKRLDPKTQDTRAIAATQAAMGLGLTAFYRNIEHVLGIEGPDAIARVGRARLFLMSERVAGEDVRAQLEQSLEQYEQHRTAEHSPDEPIDDDDLDESAS